MKFLTTLCAIFCTLVLTLPLSCDTPTQVSFSIRPLPEVESPPNEEKGWIQHFNFDGVPAELDRAAHVTFGKGLLELSGYYQHELFSGIFREDNEVNPLVKITLLNGMLSAEEDLEYILQTVSNTHGGNQIHFVYRPTEGWTKDLYSCILSKIGVVSPQAERLAQIWKQLIQDMGGPGAGGTIVHYAHSVGGTDSFVAGCLLTEEEQKMIHVYTIGSPTLIPTNSGFASATNIVSVRDIIGGIDVIRYIIGLVSTEGNVCYVGTLWGKPFVDHLFSGEAYQKAIHQLGEEFLQKYN